MPTDDQFDFIRAFMGVDILAVDAVGEIVGHCVAALIKGMEAAGLDAERADKIITDVVKVFCEAIIRPPGNQPPQPPDQDPAS